MFSAAELNEMRSTVATTFDATATQLVKSNVSDGRGGRTVEWIASRSFPARLSTNPPSSRQMIELGQVVSETTYSLVYAIDIRLKANDRISCLGNEYEILGVHETSSIDLHSRASLRRIQ